MYLAPINYDRFFKRVFSDLNIAKQFLEALLGIVITEIELLPRKNKITDDAAFTEFDFRCKVNGEYIIIEMQQRYKEDVVKRFFMYFCINTALQLETIPVVEVPIIDKGTNENKGIYRTKSYDKLEPSITLIWMANDSLGLTDDIVGFSVFPESLYDFIRNESLWATNDLVELLRQREKIIKILDNNTKGLDFLRKNRLIYAFQSNIVKNKALMNPYYEWFDFAQKTRNKNNKKSDFDSFLTKPVFMDIIEKLKTTTFQQDDWQYISDRVEYENIQRKHDAKQAGEARDEVRKEYEPKLAKAEQEKQKAENLLKLTIRKHLKRGDTIEFIEAWLEIDSPSLERFLAEIALEDAEVPPSV